MKIARLYRSYPANQLGILPDRTKRRIKAGAEVLILVSESGCLGALVGFDVISADFADLNVGGEYRLKALHESESPIYQPHWISGGADLIALTVYNRRWLGLLHPRYCRQLQSIPIPPFPVDRSMA
jgi:hypothetical protein